MTKTKLNWEKCPSVSPGGKPYFWYLVLNIKDNRICFHVVWNRIQEKWVVQKNHEYVTYAESAEKGKKFVEELFENENE